MLTLSRLSWVIVMLLSFALMNNPVSAAPPTANTGMQYMQGKIDHIDTSRNVLVVDDMSYAIATDVSVVTAAGHTGRMSSLYPGKRVRLLVQFHDTGNTIGTIHKIYLLR